MTIKKDIIDYNFPQELKDMDENELSLLAAQIRDFLISSVAETGGHLSSNLGVIELTIAIHRVFDLPNDKVVWDVGHQSYTHKILSGRAGQISTLRKCDGLSGFTRPAESHSDVIASGHTSTSVSTAMGLAEARNIKEETYDVVGVIGDGALTGGPAFEGLNNAGTKRTKMIMILNDNNMSISHNVGSLNQHLSKLRASKSYQDMKRMIKRGVTVVPGIGKSIFRGLEHLRDLMRYALIAESLFEDMGFSYYGPVDGHDIKEMTDIFAAARNIDGPVLIHVVTKKGKGYKNAEDNPDYFHGIGPFDRETGTLLCKSNKMSWSSLAGRELIRIAEKDDRVIAITAAMAEGTGLNSFAENYPKRFYDVGIAEGHAVSFASGLAIAGLRPFVCIYSSFLQRGYDQIICDVALNSLPVVFLIDRAGNAGSDGEIHHGMFDLSYLGHIPGLTILAPADEDDFIKMIDYALAKEDGPLCIRYPRGAVPELPSMPADVKSTEISTNRAVTGLIDISKNRKLTDIPTDTKKAITILAVGNMTSYGLSAAEILKEKDIFAEIVSVRSVKPLDEESLINISAGKTPIITLEDNVLRGGFGEVVCAFYDEKNIEVNIKCLGWNDSFVPHGDTAELYCRGGLDPVHIAKKAEEILGRLDSKVFKNPAVED